MKRCSYCGKEYSDDVTQCIIDGRPLEGGEQEIVPPASNEAGVLERPGTPARPIPKLTDRQLRIFELLLICGIAFGSSILGSFYFLLKPEIHATGRDSSKWVFGIIREGTLLVLLWYVLLRRSKSFSDIGFSWRGKRDIAWSIALRLAASIVFRAIYLGIFSLGLVPATRATSSSGIASYLFYGGITFATLVYHFVNPFFEELIVRAYVMTEVKELTQSSAKAILLSTALQTSYHFYQGIPAAVAHVARF